MNVVINGARGSFFRPEQLEDRLAKGQAKALSKCGAFVRTRAKSSLKYAKKSASPGQPPRVHRSAAFNRSTFNKKLGQMVSRPTSPLKELLYFAMAGDGKSVLIGPMEFRQSRSEGYKVPALLEKGGTVSVRTHSHGLQTKRYPAFPFMKPAMEKEIPKFQGVFANITGGG